MDVGIDQLTAEERAEVRSVLLGLANSLQARKGMGISGLVPDEEIVLNSLMHPERGDVGIIAMRSERGRLEIFVVNRRDPDSPFAVMSGNMLRDYPERRFLSSRPGHSLRDDEFSLFLITQHDKDQLRAPAVVHVKTYSSSFQLYESGSSGPVARDELAGKTLQTMSADEKLAAYRRGFQGDSRRDAIEKELFGFPFAVPRYKAATREEVMVLPPENYKPRLAQLIREMYPYGVRVSLRRDFPQEHKAKIAEVHQTLLRLAGLVQQRRQGVAPQPLNAHYDEVEAFLREVVEKDPELSHFV